MRQPSAPMVWSWRRGTTLACLALTLLARAARSDDAPPAPNPLAPPTGGTRSVPTPTAEEFHAREAERARALEERIRKEQADRERAKAESPDQVMVDGVRALMDSLEHFDVERRQGQLWTHHFESSTAVQQDFLAVATGLVSLELKLDDAAGAALRVIDVARGGELLAAKPLSPEAFGLSALRFDPPLPLRPGDFYRIELARTTEAASRPLRCYVSLGDAIPFAGLKVRDATGAFVARKNGDATSDLAIRIVGRDLVRPPAGPAPSKRALLVLLDRVGLDVQVSGLERVALAVYHGPALTSSVEFVMSGRETLAEVIARQSGRLETYCEAATRLEPPWDTYEAFEMDDTPAGYTAAVEKKRRLAAQLLPQVKRLERWKIETRADPDLLKAEREKLRELTAERIHLSAGAHFDKVLVLEGRDLSAENLLRTIVELAPTHRIDLHILAGGSPDGIAMPSVAGGAPAHLDPSSFFLPLRRAMLRGEVNPRLESVYSVADFRGLLVSAWRAIGAKSVMTPWSATYLPHQYVEFLRHWLAEGASSERSWHSESHANNLAREFARKSSRFAAEHPDLYGD